MTKTKEQEQEVPPTRSNKAARESKRREEVREEYERRYKEAKANFFVNTKVRGNHNDGETFCKVKENKWNESGEKRTISNEDTALSNKSPDMDPMYEITNQITNFDRDSPKI